MENQGTMKSSVKKSNFFADSFSAFGKGNAAVKFSAIIYGLGLICKGQFVKGFALLATEAGLIYFIVAFGWNYFSKITTLGTVQSGYNPNGTISYGDNSFLILLFGLLTVFVFLALIALWFINMHENHKVISTLEKGEELPTNKKVFESLFDNNIDKTLLALPVIGIFTFVVLPIFFMICVAFTNYDKTHQSPSKLFTWVGLDNFKELFSLDVTGYGHTFLIVLVWTLVWAFFATFLNYFLGIGVAMLINRKGIKFKKLWRTILVMTIAIPQFISLLYMYKMFTQDGLVNSFLLRHNIISEALPFWTNPTWARVTVIVINLWVGIPYLMLIATGLLMNIPADLYESAKIDGASPWQSFWHITLPYMLFVTGPYLLTSYVGNLNNFNIIFLLTRGNPVSQKLMGKAGYTDLLVTWLYKMTVDETNYRIAAVIGIMVFLVTATISLVVYGLLPSVKDEEGFQ